MATGLADDHPVRAAPQGGPDEVGQRDAADALHVVLPLAHRDLVGMQLGQQIEAEFGGVLDDHDPLAGRDLVARRPQQRGLAGSGAATE